jgi:hypothetical protein
MDTFFAPNGFRFNRFKLCHEVIKGDDYALVSIKIRISKCGLYIFLFLNRQISNAACWCNCGKGGIGIGQIIKDPGLA